MYCIALNLCHERVSGTTSYASENTFVKLRWDLLDSRIYVFYCHHLGMKIQ